MMPKLGKNLFTNVALSAVSAFVVELMMHEKMRNRLKRGLVGFRDFMSQLKSAGADAYRKSRGRVR